MKEVVELKKAIMASVAALIVLGPALAAAEQSDSGRAARVRQALERMEAEPTVLEVHRAALRYFRVNPQAIEDIRRRAVSRAGAPRLTIGGRYERIDSQRFVDDVQVPLDTTDDFSSNVYGGTLELSWDLPGAVFNPAQLQAYALIGIQMNVLKEVTRLYYVRRQLLLSLLSDPPSDPRSRVAMRMRVEEFTSLIDSFTGGWFSRNLPENSDD